MEHRSTIQEVAKRAGVSNSTVSRVLNKNYPVKEETRKRVEEAIEALQFKPNLLARSLIQDKSHTIGILTPSIENLFFSQVVKGIDRHTRPQDYITFLCTTDGDPGNERRMLDTLLNRSVDGIIVIDPQTENVKSGLYEKVGRRIPLVLVNGWYKGVDCNYVLNDEVAGAVEALGHFLREGHRRIAFLRGNRSHSYDVKEEAYREFLAEEGLEPKGGQVLRIADGNGQETVEQARRAVREALGDRQGTFDALLCCNDWMALGALRAVRELKLVPGREISIMGFDNTLISEIADIPISTVDHHMTRLGQTAAQRLFEVIGEPKQKTRKIIMQTDLVIRST
ncbi:LacI family DNA-binding transcriptional regulator [Anaerotalea alkaliphila]|uniref:LacI family transcriptional regulator n=1 Tax=Anaerotalea alkaliphila TaxID=2662126 RepID=A0A7X5HV69_9FIRM|nr:LacI family DNA-binding transcriptional regulator [Anaerotalea alkaliphila]NDL67076.1 LacI family transcriptional regulator [Anaerotalea alkaliphila]